MVLFLMVCGLEGGLQLLILVYEVISASGYFLLSLSQGGEFGFCEFLGAFGVVLFSVSLMVFADL